MNEWNICRFSAGHSGCLSAAEAHAPILRWQPPPVPVPLRVARGQWAAERHTAGGAGGSTWRLHHRIRRVLCGTQILPQHAHPPTTAVQVRWRMRQMFRIRPNPLEDSDVIML